MEEKEKYYETKVTWAQVDANRHLRHSAYADIATQARIEMLEKIGLGYAFFERMKMGPVIFREEFNYLREVMPNETVKVISKITHSYKNGSKYSIQQDIYREDGLKAAFVNLDGAWINLIERKLINIPTEVAELFKTFPKSEFYLEE